MKHLFTVHSPITYYCSLEIIRFHKLPEKDVIIIAADYKIPFPVVKVVRAFHESETGILSKFRRFNFVKHYDRFIAELVDESPFVAYVDLLHYYQKILVTHPLCQRFNFMEEGTASYMQPKSLEDLTRIELNTQFRADSFRETWRGVIRVCRGYSLRLLALPYFANAYAFMDNVNYYGFSQEIFPGVNESKKIVLNPDVKENSLNGNGQISNSIILIEESFFHAYRISNDKSVEIHNASTKEIGRLRVKHRGKIFIKLRPNQNSEDSLWIPALKHENIEYEILSDKIILEQQLISSTNCTLFGTVSSLLYYGAIFGHKSYSNYGLLGLDSIALFDAIDFYWNRVDKLTRSLT